MFERQMIVLGLALLVGCAGAEAPRGSEEARATEQETRARMVEQRARARSLELVMQPQQNDSALIETLRGAGAEDDDEIMRNATGVGFTSDRGEVAVEPGGGGRIDSPRELGESRGEPPPEPMGRVVLGAVERVSGAGNLDSALVTRALRRRLRSIQRCYERELRQNPTITGLIVVELTILHGETLHAGTIRGARASENTTGSPATAECAVNVARRLRFNPPPEGGDVTHRAFFVFAPVPR